jgi:hypothetical protein
MGVMSRYYYLFASDGEYKDHKVSPRSSIRGVSVDRRFTAADTVKYPVNLSKLKAPFKEGTGRIGIVPPAFHL